MAYSRYPLRREMSRRWAGPTLRLMDHVGNSRHGVALPYHYWTRRQWEEAFASLELRIATWTTQLHLYPWPASLIFDRALHVLTTVEVPASRSRSVDKTPA